jgi:hypothetical protein
MELPISTVRVDFTGLTMALLSSVRQLQHSLKTIQNCEKPDNRLTSRLRRIAHTAGKIEQVVSRLLTIQTLTLYDQEYTRFCDLIICGSEMAKYLTTTQTSKTMREHAHYWQKICIDLKPFIKGNL